MSSTLILDEEYPEVLADIAREIHSRLMDHPLLKLEHPIAAEVALGVAEHVRKNIGGVATYIPRGLGYELSVRDRQMFEEFTGDNYHQLARKYELTEMRVRQVIAHVMRIERAKRQQNLF
ncbi:Mor family transcriptional regulator [Paucimonas lemoignei]|uniref:Mor family transcriptional regulator n=1 Tax=Paucimonas lemoignei TaxID=29443 RepID=A0A4R3HZ25_PAULE|nr:Mor transcription activator family protein [Paucimonas lemoignei]TCS38488.1 Mor family transcriptional regulator [Paucimonas lemoignei]